MQAPLLRLPVRPEPGALRAAAGEGRADGQWRRRPAGGAADADGLPHPARGQLAPLSADLLPRELRRAADAHLRPLRLHAAEAVAGRAGQRREPSRPQEGHAARPRRRRRLCHLLVSHTGPSAFILFTYSSN